MLKKITIVENILEPESSKTFECENIVDFLIEYFEKWPSTARIYNKEVAETCDVTPSNEKEIENLLTLDGDFIIVVYPGEFATVALIVSLVVLATVVFMPKPKIPNPTVRTGNDNKSANNELSNRSNKARINARIPDIFGEVRSIPDLLALPYKIFKNNVEIEHSYLCIGKGEYEILDVREDTTLISQIDGSSVEVYGPSTSPNSGDTPILSIGVPIETEIKNITRYTSVNGQVLAPQALKEINYNDIVFTSDLKIIKSVFSHDPDFTTLFSNGDSLVVKFAYEFASSGPEPGDFEIVKDFDGIYTISTVLENEITVTSTNGNISWDDLVLNSSDSNPINGTLQSDQLGGIGPFIINKQETEQVWCNFVAQNGIYKDNGTEKLPFPVEIILTLTPIDANENEIGAPEEFSSILLWNGSDNLSVGCTVKAVPTFTGRCKAFARRSTPKTILSGYQVYEEIKWRDLYSVSSINKEHFGNVTTVQTLTIANSGALEINQRKLNMLVTRKIPTRISGNTFSTVLYPTKQVDDIISFICLDPFMGNRSVSEIDFDNIYETVAEIISYFGTEKASEFSYTFDSSNLSFEEIIISIANSCFCIAYRRGNKIKISFEKEKEITTILFNHRNKIPNSEVRSINFGNNSDNDGIEFQYINPIDDSVASIFLPEDQSAINPEIIESIGVRNQTQAYFIAKRLFNKLKYQNYTIEFEGTQEANICVINDRILVSDGTRSGSFEGEVLAQNILELTLSQNLNLLDGVDYTIFLQYKDGSVESMPITKTSSKNKIILDHAPLMSLVTNYDAYAKTTFIITSNDDTRKMAFLLTEKSPKGVMTSELKAVNYDARYYQNDKDLINAIITE